MDKEITKKTLVRAIPVGLDMREVSKNSAMGLREERRSLRNFSIRPRPREAGDWLVVGWEVESAKGLVGKGE